MSRWRNDSLAWKFGTVAGGGTGFLFLLLTQPSTRQKLQTVLPVPLLGIDAIDWFFLLLLLSALLIFPSVTILLAQRRTFSRPLLSLASFFAFAFWAGVHSLTQAESSLKLTLSSLCMFSLLAWVPYSRTVLFSGNKSLADDKSCGPRALYLACHALNMRVTIIQVRRLTKLTARGTYVVNLERAAASLNLAVKRVPMGQLASVQPPMPALAIINWGGSGDNHAIAVLAIEGNKVRIHDPNQPWEKIISLESLKEASRFDLLTLSRLNAPAEVTNESVWPPAPQSEGVK